MPNKTLILGVAALSVAVTGMASPPLLPAKR